MWYHFQFISGANPYISKSEKDAKKNVRLWKKKGYTVTKLENGFYIVDDSDPASKYTWSF